MYVGEGKNGVGTSDQFQAERDVAFDWTILSGAVSKCNESAFCC